MNIVDHLLLKTSNKSAKTVLINILGMHVLWVATSAQTTFAKSMWQLTKVTVNLSVLIMQLPNTQTKVLK